jgi:hypothetical protein
MRSVLLVVLAATLIGCEKKCADAPGCFLTATGADAGRLEACIAGAWRAYGDGGACSPIPCTASGGPPECRQSDCTKYSFTLFVPAAQGEASGVMYTGSFVRSASAGTWSNPLPPERFAYTANETTLVTDGGSGPRSQSATCTQQQLVLGEIVLKERSSAAESEALTGLLRDGGTWSGVAAP